MAIKFVINGEYVGHNTQFGFTKDLDNYKNIVLKKLHPNPKKTGI
ncbi:hypothetical protein [Sulfurimonas sediminis]|nr:hypothetical protein [Sulfurimonas sediminis]